MAQSSIKLSLLADASKMKAGLADADRAIDKTSKKADSGGSSLTGYGKAAVAGLGVAAAGAVVAFAASAVKAFSDVEQSAGSVESVFGESADSIKDQAAGAAEAFGLSASEFQSSAALIGSMLKNQLGISADEAAGQVDDLIGKASDLAATFGGTTSEAVSAISSLLRGERDPIERYGISMNDASITAHALAEGLADSTAAMTPQIKAAAALDLLFKQSEDSAGQFSRETDTLAGSQQILAANIENTKAAIGEELAPAVSAAMGVMSDLIPVVESLTSALGGAGEAIVPLLDQLKISLGLVPDTAVGLENVGFALANTILPFLQPVIGGWKNINDVLGLNNVTLAESSVAMDTARHSAGKHKTAVDTLAGAEEDLTGAIHDTITARSEAFDQVRAQSDTFFALVDATQDQADAQAAVNEMERLGLQNTPSYTEAVRLLAEKSLAVWEAQLALQESGGMTRAEFEKQRVAMGLDAAQAQVLIDKYDLLFTDRTATYTTVFQYHGRQPTADNPFATPGAASGGVVPGTGPRLMVVHGGETIHNAGQEVSHQSNSGTPVVVNVYALDPQTAARSVVQALQSYNRTNGAVPVVTRTP